MASEMNGAMGAIRAATVRRHSSSVAGEQAARQPAAHRHPVGTIVDGLDLASGVKLCLASVLAVGQDDLDRDEVSGQGLGDRLAQLPQPLLAQRGYGQHRSGG